MSQHDTLTQALQEIADWNSHTTEFAVDYGSNGVRDFYRCIARAALSDTQPAQAAQGAGEVVAWTSVNDALPDGEPGDPEVLFYSDDKRNPVDTAIGVYRADGWFSCGVEFVNVTHWKPKPANPSDTQPAAGADVPDMVEIMALADSYRNATCQEATATPPAPAQPVQGVPEGWEIREDDTWIYFKRPDGFCQAVTPNDPHTSHAQTLHMLMRAMLTASPTPPAQQGEKS